MQLNTAENIYKAVLDGIKKESTAVLTPEAFNRLINNSALTEWLVDKAGDADKDQPVVDALRNLYRYTAEINIHRNGEIKLPGDYYRLQSVIFYKGRGYDGIPGKRSRTDSLSMMYVNPHRKPNDKRVYYFQVGDKVVQSPRNNNILFARLYYLSRPEPIIYHQDSPKDGNLLPEQNKEVVDICVRVFLERTKDERYQSNLMEENIKMQKRI